MKHILIVFIFLNLSSSAQRTYETCFNFCNSFPNQRQMNGIGIINSLDFNGTVSLIQPGYPYSGSAIYLTRIDSTGNQLWNKVIRIDSSEIHIHNVNDTDIIKSLIPESIVSGNNVNYFVGSSEKVFVTITDTSGNHTYSDTINPFIIKVDLQGNIVWSTRIEMPKNCYLLKLIPDSIDNLYVMSGNSLKAPGFAMGDSIIYLTKLDSSGNIDWTKEYNAMNFKINNADMTFINYELIIALTIDNDCMAIKVDTSGNTLWSYRYDTGSSDRLVSIRNSINGFVIGLNRSLAPHPIVINLDSSGALIGAKSFARDTSFQMTHFIPFISNGFFMIHYSDSEMMGGHLYKHDILFIDSGMNRILHKNLDTYSITFSWWSSRHYVDFIKAPNSIITLLQQLSDFQGTTSSLPFIEQLDYSYNFCWAQTDTVPTNLISYENIVASGSTIFSGNISINSSPAPMLFYDSLLAPTVCSIIVDKIDEQTQSAVTIFPNPFSTISKIAIRNDHQQNLSCELRIYNTLGALVREEQILNINSYILHRGDMSEGMYFYELHTDRLEPIGTGKFIIE